MSQPLGFVSSHHPSHFICKLNKSLYTSFLPGFGFQASLVDQSLFVKHTSLGIVVLLLYVVDIILTMSSYSGIVAVILELTKTFDMKDLGQLNYFLGLQISYHSNAYLFLSKSISEIC